MKIAVYTALFGDRDVFLPPLNFVSDAGVDWFVFTDSPSLKVSPYKVIHKETVYEDLAKNARYFKILGDDLLKSYDLVLWHDANIQLDASKLKDLVSYANTSYLTTFKHPNRDDFYSEAMSCIRVGKDHPFLILKQALVYFFKGMPAHNGLCATGILMKNKLYANPSFMTFWWEQVQTYSRRDQLALAYSSYKLEENIRTISLDILDNPFSIYHLHSYPQYKDRLGNAYTSSAFSRRFAFQVVKLLRKLKKL